MPDYSENDLKAIQGLMVFDDTLNEHIRSPGYGLSSARSFATSYAKADHDQFANLMKFDVSLVPPPAERNQIQRSVQPILGRADEELDGAQPFYTKSDFSLFGRIPLPGLLDASFDSGTGADRSGPAEAPRYTAADLKVFSDLMQFQPEAAEQPALIRRENLGRTAMKIVDTDSERAAARRNYWSEQPGMKIVFSNA